MNKNDELLKYYCYTVEKKHYYGPLLEKKCVLQEFGRHSKPKVEIHDGWVARDVHN